MEVSYVCSMASLQYCLSSFALIFACIYVLHPSATLCMPRLLPTCHVTVTYVHVAVSSASSAPYLKCCSVVNATIVCLYDSYHLVPSGHTQVQGFLWMCGNAWLERCKAIMVMSVTAVLLTSSVLKLPTLHAINPDLLTHNALERQLVPRLWLLALRSQRSCCAQMSKSRCMSASTHTVLLTVHSAFI